MGIKAKELCGWCIVTLLSAGSLEASDRDVRLIQAVKDADKAAVRALLKQGADANVREGDGATALHWAAFRGDPETVDLLVGRGAAVNATNDLGVTPLWVACGNGSVPVITRLLKAGANPNAAPPTGGTPLMIASRTGNTEAVGLLLARGADVNARETSREQTALMWAVSQQHADVVRVLLAHGADLHARSKTRRQFVLTCCPLFNGDLDGAVYADQGGFTPLLFAARQGDIDSARLLLDAGANVNEVLPDGTSALVLAAHSGNGTFAAFLLDHGADPNADGGGYTALHAAVLRGDLALAKTLLAHRANPNARLMNGTPSRRNTRDFAFDKVLIGATPFLLAAKYAQADLMRILAGSGADLSLTLTDGTTPLMAAVRQEEERFGGTRPISSDADERERLALEAAKVAVELGVDVNAVDDVGDTALHIAAFKRANRIIPFLVERHATLDAMNEKGQTPLAMVTTNSQMAKRGGFVLNLRANDAAAVRTRETEALLRKLGAKE